MLWGGGHIADVHDLLFNVLGVVAGYGLLVAGSRVPAVAGLLARFRWR